MGEHRVVGISVVRKRRVIAQNSLGFITPRYRTVSRERAETQDESVFLDVVSLLPVISNAPLGSGGRR